MNAEAAKELKQLEIWKSLLGELDSLIAFEEKKFRICKPEEVPAIQQKIMAYESCKSIPDMVIDRDSE